MIGLPAALLGAIAILRWILYRRQRRHLLHQGGQPSLRSACEAALDRAKRILRAELARVFVAMVLLIVIAAAAFNGSFGAGLTVMMALAAYVAETVIAAAATVGGMRGKGGALLAGAVPAMAVAWIASVLVAHLVWPAWLLATMLTGVIALGAYQLCDWLWLRPRREPRSPLTDRNLLRRMNEVAQQCGVGDVRFFVVQGDLQTVNARAESDPRGRGVVLWPALLERLDPDEVDAAIAHELGHLAFRHLQARFLNTAALFCVATALSSLVASTVWAPRDIQASLHVATTVVLLPLILAGLRGRQLALYRRQEIEADDFVRGKGRGDALVDALLRLSPSIVAGPGSDTWHHRAYDSHPPTELRLAHLRAVG